MSNTYAVALPTPVQLEQNFPISKLRLICSKISVPFANLIDAFFSYVLVYLDSVASYYFQCVQSLQIPIFLHKNHG